MNLRNFFMLVVIAITLQGCSKEHYTTTQNPEPNLVGKVYNINKPMAYLEGLGHCNSISKSLAINTSCLLDESAQYKLIEIIPQCSGCLRKESMPNPLKVKYIDNPILTVVKDYNSSNNYKLYRFFGSKSIGHMLLRDERGNLIEIQKARLELMSSTTSREESKLMAAKDTGHIVKLLCFTPGENHEKAIIGMLKDFGLEKSVSVSSRDCRPNGMGDGVVISTKSFDDFLTFNYFRHDWLISGIWL